MKLKNPCPAGGTKDPGYRGERVGYTTTCPDCGRPTRVTALGVLRPHNTRELKPNEGPPALRNLLRF